MDLVGVEEVGKKGDGLAGLAKPHFVRKDGVVPLGPRKREPVESLQLVVAELSTHNVIGL